MERAIPVRKPNASTADLLTWSEVPPATPSARSQTVRSYQPSDGIKNVVFGGQVTKEESESLMKSSQSGGRSHHQPSSDGIKNVVFGGQVTKEESESLMKSSQSGGRSHHQPSDGIKNAVFGGQVTEEENESLMKRKPCSGHKMKEMTGSGIFEGDAAPNAETVSATKTGYRQALKGISQISFSSEEDVPQKKPTSIHEMAKQRELCGNLQSEPDTKANHKKQISDTKSKELSGHNIFESSPENPLPTRSSAAAAAAARTSEKDIEQSRPRNARSSVKVSYPAGGHSNNLFGEDRQVLQKTTKKLHNPKSQELTGNDIFNGDGYNTRPPNTAEEQLLSQAKMREFSGSRNNIFSGGGKAETQRDHFGGARRPPGGESTISLS